MRDSSIVPAENGATGSVFSHRRCGTSGAAGLLRAVVLLGILTCGCGLAQALEFREVRWGFSGAVKRHAFNLCSIDLHNTSPDAFRGAVELTKLGHVGSSVIPLIEPDVYIGPGEVRTVQFLPFIGSDKPEWQVRWGQRKPDSFDFQYPTREFTTQVAVQFVADQGVSSPLRGIVVFKDNDFPTGAAGTETLGSVVLDHVPRWDQVRGRAFRDWLGRGGRLYLLNGRDGQSLRFPSPLDELNVPADRFLVGQGVVIRVGIVQDAGQIPGLINEVAQSAFDPNNPNAYQQYETDPATEGVKQLFQTLRNMVRPDHDWRLIFFLAFIYLLILFPGIWLVSRKRGDFRVTYAMILGTVLLFSWLYAEIGKRGYDETMGLREMMVAYPLGNQRVALNKHGSLFVTEGGSYEIPAQGEGAVLSLESGPAFSGNATIINRPYAGVVADIPPFSACSYQASSVLPTQADYSIQVQALELNPTFQKVSVQLGAGIPESAQVYLLSAGQVYALTRQGAMWTNSSLGMPVKSQFPIEYDYGYSRHNPVQMEKNLIAYLVQVATSTSLSPQYQGMDSPTVPNAANAFEGGQILVYCDAPAEFLPRDYPASGKVLFVSKVDASMATTAAP